MRVAAPSVSVTVNGSFAGALGKNTVTAHAPSGPATAVAAVDHGLVMVTVAPGVAVPWYSS